MLTKQHILSQVNETDIYEKYVQGFTPEIIGKRNIKSIFNEEDKTPSLSFYKPADKVLFKCFSTGLQGDCFNLIGHLYNFDCKSEFNEILKKICFDFNIQINEGNKISKIWNAEYYSEFTKAAIQYWNQYKITIEILKRYNVRQLKRLKYKTHNNEFESKNIIAFEFDISGRRKIYCPKQENLTKKVFYKTQTKNDVFGLKQVIKSNPNIILICEGEKDSLVANSLGIPSISFQSCNTIPTKDIIRKLTNTGADIVVCYDNDSPGQNAMQNLCEKYNFAEHRIPVNYNDIADYLPSVDIEKAKSDIKESLAKWRKGNNFLISVKNKSYYRTKGATVTKISNFILQVDCMITGLEKPLRQVKLIGSKHQTITLRIPNSIFSSDIRFTEFARDQKGHFSFTGTYRDLQEITNRAFMNCDYYEQAKGVGWINERKLFILSNGIIKDNQFLKADTNGLVDNDLIIPAACNDYINSEDDNNHIKYTTPLCNSKLSMSEFYKLIELSFGKTNSICCLSYLISSINFDWLSKKFTYFPMLNIAGQRGTGKGSLIKMMLSPFTINPKEVGLSNTTSTFLTRKLEQSPCIPVWFDEFLNQLPSKTIQVLKGFYDLIGKSQALKTNDNKTKRTKILSPVIITGEESPSSNEALYSRLICLNLQSLKDTQDSMIDHQNRMRAIGKGVSHLLIDLIELRTEIKNKFDETYDNLISYLNESLIAFDLKPDTRVVKNYALIFSPILIGYKNLKLPIDDSQIRHAVFNIIKQHIKNQESIDEVTVFLNHLIQMASLNMPNKNRLTKNQDYAYDESKDEFYILSSVFSRWGQYARELTGRHSKDPRAIEKYLKSKAYYKKSDRYNFETSNGESKKQQRCKVLVASKLPDFFRNYFIV